MSECLQNMEGKPQCAHDANPGMATMIGAVKPRLHHMDVIKGLAIFMVVMGHVLTMCVRDIDRATVFKFVGEMHMPLFFFISGWFTFKLVKNGTGVAKNSWQVPALWSRAQRLLIPMLVMSSLWIVYFPHSGLESPLNSTFSGLWLSEFKNGYWFTLVLFEIIAIYAACVPLLSRVKTFGSRVAIGVGVWVALRAVCVILPADVEAVMSFGLVSQFFPIFLAGALASAYRENFMRLTRSSIVYTTAFIVGGFLLYFVCWNWEFESWHIVVAGIKVDVEVARVVFEVAFAFVVIAVIAPWCERAFGGDKQPSRSQHRFANMWQLLGRESLTIYLMHYFFLFPMGLMRPMLEGMKLGFVPTLAFAMFWSAIIIAVVLGFNRLIEPSRLLSFIMAGRQTKQK